MSRTDSAWHDVNAALTDPNLRAAAVFAIIGLLESLCLTLLLPLSAVTAVLFAQLT